MIPGSGAVPAGGFLQPRLEGPTLLLRPLGAGDFEALYAAAADPLLWEQHPEPLRYRRDVFEGFFAGAIASRGALLVIDKPTAKVIGTSRYYDLDAAWAEVAIGYTFLARSHWGGPSNREMKTLMLDHAFGRVRTVWFHVGPANFRSRRALEKIGARLSHAEPRSVGGSDMQDWLCYRLDRDEYAAGLGVRVTREDET